MFDMMRACFASGAEDAARLEATLEEARGSSSSVEAALKVLGAVLVVSPGTSRSGRANDASGAPAAHLLISPSLQSKMFPGKRRKSHRRSFTSHTLDSPSADGISINFVSTNVVSSATVSSDNTETKSTDNPTVDIATNPINSESFVIPTLVLEADISQYLNVKNTAFPVSRKKCSNESNEFHFHSSPVHTNDFEFKRYDFSESNIKPLSCRILSGLASQTKDRESKIPQRSNEGNVIYGITTTETCLDAGVHQPTQSTNHSAVKERLREKSAVSDATSTYITCVSTTEKHLNIFPTKSVQHCAESTSVLPPLASKPFDEPNITEALRLLHDVPTSLERSRVNAAKDLPSFAESNAALVSAKAPASGLPAFRPTPPTGPGRDAPAAARIASSRKASGARSSSTASLASGGSRLSKKRKSRDRRRWLSPTIHETTAPRGEAVGAKMCPHTGDDRVKEKPNHRRSHREIIRPAMVDKSVLTSRPSSSAAMISSTSTMATASPVKAKEINDSSRYFSDSVIISPPSAFSSQVVVCESHQSNLESSEGTINHSNLYNNLKYNKKSETTGFVKSGEIPQTADKMSSLASTHSYGNVISEESQNSGCTLRHSQLNVYKQLNKHPQPHSSPESSKRSSSHVSASQTPATSRPTSQSPIPALTAAPTASRQDLRLEDTSHRNPSYVSSLSTSTSPREQSPKSNAFSSKSPVPFMSRNQNLLRDSPSTKENADVDGGSFLLHFNLRGGSSPGGLSLPDIRRVKTSSTYPSFDRYPMLHRRYASLRTCRPVKSLNFSSTNLVLKSKCNAIKQTSKHPTVPVKRDASLPYSKIPEPVNTLSYISRSSEKWKTPAKHSELSRTKIIEASKSMLSEPDSMPKLDSKSSKTTNNTSRAVILDSNTPRKTILDLPKIVESKVHEQENRTTLVKSEFETRNEFGEPIVTSDTGKTSESEHNISSISKNRISRTSLVKGSEKAFNSLATEANTESTNTSTSDMNHSEATTDVNVLQSTTHLPTMEHPNLVQALVFDPSTPEPSIVDISDSKLSVPATIGTSQETASSNRAARTRLKTAPSDDHDSRARGDFSILVNCVYRHEELLRAVATRRAIECTSVSSQQIHRSDSEAVSYKEYISCLRQHVELVRLICPSAPEGGASLLSINGQTKPTMSKLLFASPESWGCS